MAQITLEQRKYAENLKSAPSVQIRDSDKIKENSESQMFRMKGRHRLQKIREICAIRANP